MTMETKTHRGLLKLKLAVLAAGALLGSLAGVWHSHRDHTPPPAPAAEPPPAERSESQPVATVDAPATAMPQTAAEWARTVPPELIGEAMEAALSIPQFNRRQRIVHELLRHWATYDPAAATRYAEQLRGLGSTSQLVLELAAIWGSRDIQGAADWVKSKPRDLYPLECATRIAAAAADTQPEAALALLLDLHVPIAPGYEPYLTLFSRLAAINPRRAAELALALPPVRERGRLLEAVFNRWVQSDPEAALAWSAQRANRTEQQETLQALIPALTQLWPEQAIDAVMQLPLGLRRRDAIAKLAETWAQQDIAAAVAWVKTLDSYADAAEAARALMPAWLAWDLASAQQWIEEQPALMFVSDLYSRRYTSYDWLRHLAEHDPQALADYLLRTNYPHRGMPAEVSAALPWRTLLEIAEALPVKNARQSLLHSVAWKWQAEDFRRALEWCFSLAPDTRSSILPDVANRGLIDGRISAEALLDMASQSGDNDLTKQIGLNMMYHLFESNPDEAIALFEKLRRSRSASLQPIAGAFFKKWLEHDPDEAEAALQECFLDGEINEFFLHDHSLIPLVLRKWPELAETALRELPRNRHKLRSELLSRLWFDRVHRGEAPEERIAWLDKFVTEEIDTPVFINLMCDRIHPDPDGTLRYVQNISDPTLKQLAIHRLIEYWAASHDPPGALEAAIALSDTPHKVGNVARAFNFWIERDASAAEAWLRELRSEPWRDGPVIAMVRRLYRSDPEQARAWADSITDYDLRARWLAAIDQAR